MNWTIHFSDYYEKYFPRKTHRDKTDFVFGTRHECQICCDKLNANLM